METAVYEYRPYFRQCHRRLSGRLFGQRRYYGRIAYGYSDFFVNVCVGARTQQNQVVDPYFYAFRCGDGYSLSSAYVSFSALAAGYRRFFAHTAFGNRSRHRFRLFGLRLSAFDFYLSRIYKKYPVRA